MEYENTFRSTDSLLDSLRAVIRLNIRQTYQHQTYVSDWDSLIVVL